jgi:hypothetical protein
MPAAYEGIVSGARGTPRDLVTVQVLLDLKNSDPTALTAAEAIQNLLGFGDRLAEIRRRFLHELVLQPPDGGEGRAALPGLLSTYFERTVVFWNPNKQRAWVRLEPIGSPDVTWEVLSGARRKPGDFGRPDLSRPEWDHLLVWPRGSREIPADLLPALSGWELAAVGHGELWSLCWREGATAEERSAWTRAVGAARSRREGLLCNPHAQDHRVLSGAVPMPLWSGGNPETGGISEAGEGSETGGAT